MARKRGSKMKAASKHATKAAAKAIGKAAGDAGAKRVAEPKVAMSYRLSRAKIARAQRLLGTPTATATIEEALDMVVFRSELAHGLDAAFGTVVADAFPSGGSRRTR